MHSQTFPDGVWLLPPSSQHQTKHRRTFDYQRKCLLPKSSKVSARLLGGPYHCRIPTLQSSKIKPKMRTTTLTTTQKSASFTLGLHWQCHTRRHYPCSRPFSSFFFHILFFLFLFCQQSMVISSSSTSSVVSAPENVIASLQNSSGELQSTASETLPPPYTFNSNNHHHHRSHFHLSKLFFPLASSSFPLESFKTSNTFTSQAPKETSFLQRQSQNESLPNEPNSAYRDPVKSNQISRKRKRELFALTISESEPLVKSVIRPGGLQSGGAFWTTSSVVGGRRRRVSGGNSHSGGHSGKVNLQLKSPYSLLSGPLSAFSSSSMSGNAAAANAAAAAAAGNMRMKILLTPPGFGVGMLPADQKCNFEIYPSGCFDENGSICDSSGSGLCVCRPGYSIRIASIYCLRPASIGEACYTTEQCERKVAQSGCFNYREEYREENPSAFFGPSQSSWPMGECRCRIGHRFDDLSKSCVRSLIGSWCSNVWDCQMVEEGEGEGSSGDGHLARSMSERHGNHSRQTQPVVGLQMLPWHQVSPSHVHGTRAKMANIVCESNLCSCSPFFHYNSTAEECQYVETYGQPCRPSKADLSSLTSSGRGGSGKRSARSRSAFNSASSSGSYVLSSRHHSSSSASSSSLYHSRERRSLGENEVGTLKSGLLVICGLPNVCSPNGTCLCGEGYEHQAHSTPLCQSLSKGVGIGGHFTHHGFHGGSSGRSGAKGDHHILGGPLYERGFEGHSNVGNFLEYLLYVLVPALIVILMFKPCFRRIGEWRTHIHQYNSDSDFYLAANAPVIAASVGGDCNVIAANGEKVSTGGLPQGVQFPVAPLAPFSAFGSHALSGCHAPFLFESVDGCVYGGCLQGPVNGVDPSLALVREKLQTIEETQSEDGAPGAGGNLSNGQLPNGETGGGCASCSAAMVAGDKQCSCGWGHAILTSGPCGSPQPPPNCSGEMMTNHHYRESREMPANDKNEPADRSTIANKMAEKSDGMEMIQFSKDQQQLKQQESLSAVTDREMDHTSKEISEMI